MLKRIGLLVAALLVGVSTPSFARTDFRRATQMLEVFSGELREAAKERDPTKFPPKEYNRRLSMIEAAFNQGIVSALNARTSPSAGELESELRHALSPNGPDPNVASVFTCELSGRSLYVVGYALGVGAIASRSWIGVIASPGNGKPSEVLAGVEDSLANKTVAIQPLGSGAQGGLTFLAHGINWGDPHSHLTVIAYAFDGHSLKTLLTRSGLTQGQVKVEGERIELTFLTMALGPGYPPVPVRTELYRLIPSGIKLEKSWEEKPK
jgi:hypothetical protein